MPDVVDLNLDAAPDLGPVNDGEYELSIARIAKHDTEKWAGLLVTLEIPSEPTGDDIMHPLGLPTANQTEKQQIRTLNQIKQFCAAFSITHNAFQKAYAADDFDALLGKTGWAVLKGDEYDGRPVNRVSRFVANR